MAQIETNRAGVATNAAGIATNVTDINTVEEAIAAEQLATSANANAIAANTRARWPGDPFVVPHEIPNTQGAFTMRVFLTRVDDTWPDGTRMRISASGRNGAYVTASDSAMATLAFDAGQARNLVTNPTGGLAGGNPRLQIADADGVMLESIPIRLPIITPASAGPEGLPDAPASARAPTQYTLNVPTSGAATWAAQIAPLTLQSAVNGGDSAGVATIALPITYTAYRQLSLAVWESNNDALVFIQIPVAVLSAQTADRTLIVGGLFHNSQADRSSSATWAVRTRTLTMANNDRIVSAVLE